MPAPLTPLALELFGANNTAFLATLMPDGSPQVTPIWVDTDGTNVLVNSVAGRLKMRNIERDARVAIAVADASNPERYVTVRGRVVKVTTEGAAEHMDRLSRKYRGKDFDFPSGQVRSMVVIEPDSVSGD